VRRKHRLRWAAKPLAGPSRASALAGARHRDAGPITSAINALQVHDDIFEFGFGQADDRAHLKSLFQIRRLEIPMAREPTSCLASLACPDSIDTTGTNVGNPSTGIAKPPLWQ
jgi:hypothetical protein